MKADTVKSAQKRLEEDPLYPVWGYIRVSGRSQEDNESSADQEGAIRKYCADNGMPEPKFVYEVASSTKPIFDFRLKGKASASGEEEEDSPRPVFLMLLHYLTSKEVQKHLVVLRLDRLSRHDIDQELILRNLWKDDVKVHSCFASESHMLDQDGTTDDPQRDFFRRIMAAAAVYEAKMINLRMTAGRKVKAARGGYWGGRPAFGYRSRNGELVVHHYEAEVIRLIYRLRFGEGMSAQAISNWLRAHKSPEDPCPYSIYLVYRLLHPDREKCYRGYYKSPDGDFLPRPDLTILTPAEPGTLNDANSSGDAGSDDPEEGLPGSPDGRAPDWHGADEDQAGAQQDEG